MLLDNATDSSLRALLTEQDGLVTRSQLLACGLVRADIQRLLRRRQLTRVHPGVYVDHTGPLTWNQRAWAAVLVCSPAVLGRESCLRAYRGPGWRGGDDGPVHVLIDRDRRVTVPSGVVVHRVGDLDRRARWSQSPPRDTFEAATIDVALSRGDRLDRIASLSAAVQSRRTTAARLIDEIDRRSRVPDRRWILQVLRDVASGSCSALEHGYLTRVERAHELRGARRQVRDRLVSGAIYRDVEYTCRDGSTLVVELDGRLHHDSARQRDWDLDRDLETALSGARTVRLGWGQVYGRSCRTAAAVAQLIGAALHRCPRCPTART